jgi:uncharacterized protein YqgV (UPF0045/DUF77 family)
MEISAQISLYPLGQSDLGPAIAAVWKALRGYGLALEPGTMSTIVHGDERSVFAALRDGFAEATQYGGAVMVVTVSNVCPAKRPESNVQGSA